MNDADNTPEHQAVSLVVRHLKLEDVDHSNLPQILSDIETTYGVDSASFEEASSTLHIAYDAIQCSLEGLEGIIQTHGGDIAHDWETVFKEGYYRFVDSNIRDHAVSEVWGGHSDASETTAPETSPTKPKR
ncbi:cation transporter [Aestuariicella hydrocarbonica]|uniref:Cation transporter n=1 Tax=Pseudomaricurvus hydrocarbonicus TaxID=1470433 RepID=A0A9E5JQN2_9GAMM|nr:cation transporter [Aestuariicella hydrocarbonica]NHO64917.1 cation transporter [Aestuariicella hydrocarbonica]